VAGRSGPHRSVHHDRHGGRTTDRRDDFAEVYGDWKKSRPAGTPPGPLDADTHAALAGGRDPAALSDDQALALLARRPRAGGADQPGRRDPQDVNGDDITYVVNRNINFTNVCYTGCRFCAFAQRRTDADAYTLSLQQIGDGPRRPGRPARPKYACRAASTRTCPARRISTSPRRSGAAARTCTCTVLADGRWSTGRPARGCRSGVLVRAKEAGLGSIPGTAAEILDDDVRWILTKASCPPTCGSRSSRPRTSWASAARPR